MFVIACGIIPMLTVGGLIPTFLGVTGAVGCVAISRKEAWSVVSRVALCTCITGACWALFLAVYYPLLLLWLQPPPKPRPNPALHRTAIK
jgi:hypothetical protein